MTSLEALTKQINAEEGAYIVCRAPPTVGACSARTVLPLYGGDTLGGKINSLRPISLSPAVVMTFFGRVSPFAD